MNKKVFLTLITGVAFILGLNTVAFALPCSQGSVSGSTLCQDGTTNNDFINPPPMSVNDQNFFGNNDWVFLAKQNTPGAFEGSTNHGWTVTPLTGTQSGNWSFNSSVWANYGDVMIVVKSGNDDGVFFSGYLLDSSLKPMSGTWDTGDKDLSHLTLYARGEGSQHPVPEPATMLLFGAGLAGLAGIARRKIQ